GDDLGNTVGADGRGRGGADCRGAPGWGIEGDSATKGRVGRVVGRDADGQGGTEAGAHRSGLRRKAWGWHDRERGPSDGDRCGAGEGGVGRGGGEGGGRAGGWR